MGVSVMGMYRTGKSFLLDLLMRYMKTEGPITRFDPTVEWTMGGESFPAEAYTWLVGDLSQTGSGQTLDQNQKSLEHARISEGQNYENERGFHWRPGIEKCTKGIWIWSKPFLIDAGPQKQPLAVLLMDTQGAWDSQMSSEHSACIFGITSLL